MDKPTFRTMHGVFTTPVRLYGDLVPRDLIAPAQSTVRKRRRDDFRRGFRSFALSAVSWTRELAPSRPLVPADER